MSASPAAAAPSTQFLKRPEGRIAYDVQGAGPLLVLVPGMGELRSSYRFLTPRLVAADHPEQVTGLVLLGPFVRNPPASRISLAIFRAMTAPFWVARMWKAYMPTLYSGRKPADFKEHREKVSASLRRPEYGKAFSLTTRQTDHAPAEARLLQVSAPALVVMGERDPDFKDPAAEAHWIGETLEAEVVMVPEAGHYPHSQQPEITARAILDFLDQMVPRS